MKIIKVEAIPLIARLENVPKSLLFPAASFSTFPRYGQYSLLVVITAEDGTIGIGEAWGLPSPKPAAIIINELIGPMITGRDPLHTSNIHDDLLNFTQRIGHTRGTFMEAIAGVDMALWDLKGKLLNVPVHTLLGGQQHAKIACYASPVQYFETPEESKNRAREFLGKGFTALKIKVGRNIETDIMHVAAVREEVGKQTRIMLDINCGYDVRTAIMFAKEVEQFDITWLEEPIAPEDIDGLSTIHRAINIPLATGENEFSTNGFREMFKRGAVDVIMPNINRVGLTGMSQINAMAKSFGVKLAPHGVGSGITIISTIQAMAAFNNSYFFEYNQLLNPLRHEIIANFPQFDQGFLGVNNDVGLGIILDQDAVSKYTAG
jgi:L-alanine-DL-glutamate epimerase-like enolase superfamily enzyme